ncbi:phosphoglucomutase (alpha-D-glucose-1,6-bisphosphate-dependent) [Cognatiluteimonas profundi]|uniref:phosphoglucomutase (alpha-D-glucose-1,6-bisphosphate-dependent) n=1 Tax=Cognatiluteimonas profundi TaxID=2594501 RepID=UPI00131BA572|nr:phosphoglucomutase (alpha-D-glucose-1,6-bisphosphate-dependent) [Lysobacter profundi]
MEAHVSPLAGHLSDPSQRVDVDALVAAYHDRAPDLGDPAQRVAFGTSGHRGSSLDGSFNEAHILAITQAVCVHRAQRGIDGPLFIGMDTHALSLPALQSALEVLAAHGVETRYAANGEYTPTPAISNAILVHNRGRTRGLADGIVVTPSHNPPEDGGFKYNPPNGGPADTTVTGWIQDHANQLLAAGPRHIRRMPLDQAMRQNTTQPHDFIGSYVADLASVIDFAVIRASGVRIGVDPLGGAGVHYWSRIAEEHAINLEIVSEDVDPQFGFMPLDWDGRIRMDPSSRYAMQRLIGLKDRFDVACACDTDHDRHGIVTPGVGLMPSNHYLSVAIDHLYRNRPSWKPDAAVGKTLVSSAMIDRVAHRLGRRLFEVPVGFKWFADGLFDGSLGFGCEESAGATCLRRDGTVWTTDKDGIVLGLLAAEITAAAGRDPAEAYEDLARELGPMFTDRVEAHADAVQKKRLSGLTADQVADRQLAGEPIRSILDKAPGNDAPVGGIKVIADSGWFAARPSGTEDIYKIYGESFRDPDHLQLILADAQRIVDAALAN